MYLYNSLGVIYMAIGEWKTFLIPYSQAVEELKVKFKSIRKEYRKKMNTHQ